jgi:hypothetical protein
MFAIGRRGEGIADPYGESFAMWHGPSPSEREMLKVDGESFNDYIIKFIGDPKAGEKITHEMPWKWHSVRGEWVRYQPRVLNRRHDSRFIAELGRKVQGIGRGSKWGNPYRIGRDGTREEVITMYMEHLLNSPELLDAIPDLSGKFLSCHCAPEPCHGDILIDLANPIVEEGETGWKFTKYLPDTEDIDIKVQECGRYIELVHKSSAGESDVDIFNAGFTRGLAWGIEKMTRHYDHLTKIQHDLATGRARIIDNGYEDDIPF